MRHRTVAVPICVLLCLALAGAGPVHRSRIQDQPPAAGADRFASINWLLGEWQGYGQFSNRVTYIHKKYSYDLGGMYFIERTLDMFPSESPSTEYETHQDFSVFYRDEASGELKAKGFYVEGYITGSDVTVSEDGKTIVIENTEVENGPPGMKTRFTIIRESEDRYAAVFEIAMPGREYGKLEDLVMKRVSH